MDRHSIIAGDFNEFVEGQHPGRSVGEALEMLFSGKASRDFSDHEGVVVVIDLNRDARGDDAEIIDLQVRDFGTIAGSYHGVSERVRKELTALAARGFDVSAFEKGLDDSLARTKSFDHLMDSGHAVAVDSSICAEIDQSFSLLHGVDGDIRTANWFLDELQRAKRGFERDSLVPARALAVADESKSNSGLSSFIEFAANPVELREKSRAALGALQRHVEERDMVTATRVLSEAKAFCGRMHLLSCLIRRETLVEKSAS